MEGRKRREWDTQNPISRREELFVFMSRFVYSGIFWNNYYKNNFPHVASCSLLGAPFVVYLKHAYKGDEVIKRKSHSLNCQIKIFRNWNIKVSHVPLVFATWTHLNFQIFQLTVAEILNAQYSHNSHLFSWQTVGSQF